MFCVAGKTFARVICEVEYVTLFCISVGLVFIFIDDDEVGTDEKSDVEDGGLKVLKSLSNTFVRGCTTKDCAE